MRKSKLVPESSRGELFGFHRKLVKEKPHNNHHKTCISDVHTHVKHVHKNTSHHSNCLHALPSSPSSTNHPPSSSRLHDKRGRWKRRPELIACHLAAAQPVMTRAASRGHDTAIWLVDGTQKMLSDWTGWWDPLQLGEMERRENLKSRCCVHLIRPIARRWGQFMSLLEHELCRAIWYT